MTLPRCVNLDWLEVFALEPLNVRALDAFYYISQGYHVEERAYGTRVYREMFTIYDLRDGEPLLEIRRNPKSLINDPRSCHIRLVNRTCYFNNAADLMAEFLKRNGYTFKRITRVDVCLDFERFDTGDRPGVFLRRYIERVYSKINQCDISPRGKDTWSGRDWNSISWGSPSSDVTTKLYNKTMELYDPVLKSYRKPYIRQAWQACGLVDDYVLMTKTAADGTVYTPDIWRVEFSVRSNVHNWFAIELDGHTQVKKKGVKAKNLQSMPNTLEAWNNRYKLLLMFASLAHHYFHFKYYREEVVDGETRAIRKDRCPDKVLFRWNDVVNFRYKIERDSVAGKETPDRKFMLLLAKLKEYRESTKDTQVKQSCDVIIEALERQRHNAEQSKRYSHDDYLAWQMTLSHMIEHRDDNPLRVLHELKEALKLNDRTCPFF